MDDVIEFMLLEGIVPGPFGRVVFHYDMAEFAGVLGVCGKDFISFRSSANLADYGVAFVDEPINYWNQ